MVLSLPWQIILKLRVHPEVERFFKILKSERWDEIEKQFKLLESLRREEAYGEALSALWRPIVEAYGAAEQAHLWPPQKLLDYGYSILDSLDPNMVYVGGTDAGCMIPTLLNATSDGEKHVMLTQNALADGSYLNYLQYQYGRPALNTFIPKIAERGSKITLRMPESAWTMTRSFQMNPKQIRPGEDVKLDNDKLVVSGQVAVMAVNEKTVPGLDAKESRCLLCPGGIVSLEIPLLRGNDLGSHYPVGSEGWPDCFKFGTHRPKPGLLA